MILETTAKASQQYKVMPIMISLLLAGFIGMFSETALNIALTDLMKELNITAATVQWLTTGYLLVLGILVPVSGLLLQWFTTRQLFTVSLIFSILGTFIAALAPSFPFLLAARIVQALGTGLLLPLMFNTILVIFPPHKRGAAMGTIGLVIMFAPAIGPTFSGLVLEHLNWHWIFWISLPFLVLALVFGIAYMQNVSETTKPKIDVLSIILSTIGFGGIVFGFSNAGEGSGGWSSPTVIVSLIVGVVGLILFSIRQLTMKQPMMNLRAFKYPMFILGVIMVFICMMVILSSMLLLPMYLQGGLVLTAFASGLVLLPGGILNGFMSPVTGRLFDKYGPKWLVIPGFVIVTVVLWFFSNVTTTSTAVLIIILHTCLMIGISMIMMPAQTTGLNQLPRNLHPHGTAILNTLQQVAGAIGTALYISIMSGGQKQYLNGVSDPLASSEITKGLAVGINNAFWFGVIAALIALGISLFLRKGKSPENEKLAG